MNLRLIVTILVIAAAPIYAQAQKPTPAGLGLVAADYFEDLLRVRLGHRGRQFVVGYATRALTARAGRPASMPTVQWMAPSNFKAQGYI